MVADGEEERSERVPLRVSLGRHEDVAVAVTRLLIEEEEAARDLVPQRHRGDELGVPAARAGKNGLSREMELKPFRLSSEATAWPGLRRRCSCSS